MLPGHGGGPAAVALVAFVTVAVAAVPMAGVGARGAVPGRVRVPVRGGVVAVVVVVARRVPAPTVLMVVAAGAPFNGGQSPI